MAQFVSLAEDAVVRYAPNHIVLAGTPPVGAANVYADLISRTRDMVDSVTLDTSGEALATCLRARDSHPDCIVVNRREYGGQLSADWARFRGEVAVHDASGCWYWQGGGSLLATDPSSIPYVDVRFLEGVLGPAKGPTLGAGDAFHAGYVAARLVSLSDGVHAGLAAAAIAVRSGLGVSAFDAARFRALLELLDER